MVCATVFLGALLDAFLARSTPRSVVTAVLEGKLDACRGFEGYVRARVRINETGQLVVRAFENQDTSLVSVFAASNALIRRQPDSIEAGPGDLVDVWLLDVPDRR
jgi:molybdopterin molybdotransferase